MKHLQYTSETSKTLETYACNMHFQHNVTLLFGQIEAPRLAELEAGAEWGYSRWAGVVPAASDPHAREDRGGRAGAVFAARCHCAGEGRGGRVRCLRRAAYAATLEKTSDFSRDMEADCGRAPKQRAECGCGASGGTDAHILSLWMNIWTHETTSSKNVVNYNGIGLIKFYNFDINFYLQPTLYKNVRVPLMVTIY